VNSYFDQVQREIAAAVSGGRHLPWHKRLRHPGRARVLVVVFAALVLATPAVGAVTNWFGFGKPLYVRNNGSPTVGVGRTLTPTSQLMSLRIPDAQGGPPWGVRLVHTTRRDVCLQLGRVEDGQLGALGIDDSWNNDHKFHPFPKAFNGGWGLQCGTTDAAGHAFLNVQWTGIASSANPFETIRTGGCQTPQYMPARLQRPRHNAGFGTGTSPGTCPPGTSRMVFMGLLGPDATSITYQAPDGSLQRQSTRGDDGAYLLVVPLTQRTCNLYFQGPTGARGPCGDSIGGGGSNSASPGPFSPIRAIQYRDGHTCNLEPSSRLLTSYGAFVNRIFSRNNRGKPISQSVRAKLDHELARFAASKHLTVTELRDKLRPVCPAVGYVAPNEKHLTEAGVASPITVGRITTSGLDAGATISFTARQPVTSSNNWYEVATTGPARCQADSNGPIGYGNVRAGQQLTEHIGASANCKGTIHGVVGYMQNSGPTNTESAGSGGTPGQDGSIIVGHFTLTMH
jgi:hypothetical protein